VPNRRCAVKISHREGEIVGKPDVDGKQERRKKKKDNHRQHNFQVTIGGQSSETEGGSTRKSVIKAENHPNTQMVWKPKMPKAREEKKKPKSRVFNERCAAALEKGND